MTYRKNTTRRDVQQEITDTIIRMIEDGMADGNWRRPWRTLPGAPGAFPVSIKGRSYRGANTVILLGTAMANGYGSNLWGTYKAWREKGAQVRRGEKGTLVVFWKRSTYKVEGEDDEEIEKSSLYAKGYSVFAAEQVDGFDLDSWTQERADKLPSEPERLEHVEDTLDGYLEDQGIAMGHGGDRAFYAPSQDHIQMPLRAAFRDAGGYYATLLHEAGHSTGHEARLDRDFSGRFGSQAYAFEELVAELTSAMLCGSLVIEDAPREDHARYVKSWLDVLRSDKRAIFTAASKAQAATDLILKYDVAAGAQEDTHGSLEDALQVATA